MTLYIYPRPTDPAPRRKDETMETPKYDFYYSCLLAMIEYGPVPEGARRFDISGPPGLAHAPFTTTAVAEILRRRPDPAKAQAEIDALRANLAAVTKQCEFDANERNDYRKQVNDAHGVLNDAGEPSRGRRLGFRIREYVGVRKATDAAGITAALDKFGAPDADTLAGRVEAYGKHVAALFRDPMYLRACMVGLEAKAEQLATLTRQRDEIDAQIAELENE